MNKRVIEWTFVKKEIFSAHFLAMKTIRTISNSILNIAISIDIEISTLQRIFFFSIISAYLLFENRESHRYCVGYDFLLLCCFFAILNSHTLYRIPSYSVHSSVVNSDHKRCLKYLLTAKLKRKKKKIDAQFAYKGNKGKIAWIVRLYSRIIYEQCTVYSVRCTRTLAEKRFNEKLLYFTSHFYCIVHTLRLPVDTKKKYKAWTIFGGVKLALFLSVSLSLRLFLWHTVFPTSYRRLRLFSFWEIHNSRCFFVAFFFICHGK